MEATSMELGPLAGAIFWEKIPGYRFNIVVFQILFDNIFEPEPRPSSVLCPFPQPTILQ